MANYLPIVTHLAGAEICLEIKLLDRLFLNKDYFTMEPLSREMHFCYLGCVNSGYNHNEVLRWGQTALGPDRSGYLPMLVNKHKNSGENFITTISEILRRIFKSDQVGVNEVSLQGSNTWEAS